MISGHRLWLMAGWAGAPEMVMRMKGVSMRTRNPGRMHAARGLLPPAPRPLLGARAAGKTGSQYGKCEQREMWVRFTEFSLVAGVWPRWAVCKGLARTMRRINLSGGVFPLEC